MLEFKPREKRRTLHIEVEVKLLDQVREEAKKNGLTLREIVEAGFVAFLAQKSLEAK